MYSCENNSSNLEAGGFLFKFQIPSIKYQTLFGIWDLVFGILIPAYIAFSCFFVVLGAMRVSPAKC